MNENNVEFEDVTVSIETEMAILCAIEGKNVWIPKSEIDDDSEVYKEDTDGVLIIPEWLAIDKELV